VKGLWSWDGEHWLLEVDGFLIQDGEVLNERLGYEDIFGWQLLNEKPFYYFRKGPRVGISYDESVRCRCILRKSFTTGVAKLPCSTMPVMRIWSGSSG
jgi:hypothetical protein